MVALKTSEIENFIARPDPRRPIVLVYGADAGLVSERVEALIRGAVDDVQDPFALARLSGEDLTGAPERLVEEAHTVPLFGGRRAVWIKAGNRNIAPAIEALIAAPPAADCRVVIEAGDLRRGAPLRAVCERAGQVAVLACYVDGERDLARLVDAQARSEGMSIAPDARALLTSLLGGDRLASRSEMSKLLLYARGRSRIEIDDVLAVVADASALALDAVIDAAFSGRLDETNSEYAKARSAGTSADAMISAALRQAFALHRARLDIESGHDIQAAYAGMRFHFRRETAIKTALGAWSSARLEQLIGRLAETKRDVRRDRMGLDDAIAQRALFAIAQASRRRSGT